MRRFVPSCQHFFCRGGGPSTTVARKYATASPPSCLEIGYGKRLSTAQVAAAARSDMTISFNNNKEALEALNKSCETLRTVLEKGTDIHGVTTGFGGSSEVKTRALGALQRELIRFMNVGFGDWMPYEVCRAITLVRVHTNAQGPSALRPEILEKLVTLLNKGIVARIPSRGSVSSGDGIQNSYLTGLVLGIPTVHAYVDKGADVVTAGQALHRAGIEPIALKPKEGLAMVNGTVPSAAFGAIVIEDVRCVTMMAQATTAFATEVLCGTKKSFDPFLHACMPHQGQVTAAANIMRMINTSKLAVVDTDEVGRGVRQDKYALRTSPQWIGPVLEILNETRASLEIELNGVSDNPLVDVATERVISGGNFQGANIGLRFDSLRIALQSLGRLSFAQYSQMSDQRISNGLPNDLAGGDPSCNFGLKGISISMASFLSELTHLSNPATVSANSTELHNQDVTSMALLSVSRTSECVKLLHHMYACSLYALCQAADLRFRINIIRETFFRQMEQFFLSEYSEELRNEHVAELSQLMHRRTYTMTQGIQTWFAVAYDDTALHSLFEVMDGALVEFLVDHPELTGLTKIPLDQWALRGQNFHKMSYASMKSTLLSILETAVPNPVQDTAPLLSEEVRKLYLFVRKDLDVPYDDGTMGAGPFIEVIYNALRDGKMDGVLCDMFKEKK
eukprot:PhM_4_TR14543/c0_g1_i1/m.60204/K10775/PAL; phenylalanine ammonia-lyase